MASGGPVSSVGAGPRPLGPTSPTRSAVPWKRCMHCQAQQVPFKSPREFVMHLRDFHCTKEGGSYVCRYGPNGICPSLPLDGVSDKDYEDHIARDHVASVSEASRAVARSRDSRSNSRSVSPTPSVTKVEPSVVQDQFKWTIYMSRVNLPALLNDPRLTRRETDFFSKTWGEAFERATVLPAHQIPNITREHFKRYIKKTSKRYQQHTKQSSPPPCDSSQANQVEDTFPSLKARKYDKYRAELEEIPKIFMHPGFTLENPDTFTAVFPWTQVESARQDQSGKSRQSPKLLQEKLSHYLDLVEVQIAKQIAMRSDAFFEAMASHDELQDHMKKTCAAIKQLRDKLNKLNNCTVEGPLKIMQLSRSRNNHVAVYNKLKLMSTVHQTQPMIQQLLATNDFVGALDLIGTTQEVLTQELGGIHSFRHLGSQLVEMEKVIDKMLQEEFVRYATADLNRPLEDGDSILQENQDFEVPLVLSDKQEKLVAIVLGMLRQHKYNFIDVYREEACTTLKAIVKQTVIEEVSKAEEVEMDKTAASLADQMRLLNYDQWRSLLLQVFSNLLIMLKRVKAVSCIMQEVAQIAAGHDRLDHDLVDEVMTDQTVDGHSQLHRSLSESSSIRMSVGSDIDQMISQSEIVKVNTGLRDMLYQVCDQAHDRCVKILVARAKDGFLEKLTSAEFVQLSKVIENFVNTCETICGRRSTSLRAALQSQASRFVNRFHEERKTKLSLILDNERWKQTDVPTEFQDLVDYIIQEDVLDVPDRKTESDKKPQEYLALEGEAYAVVGTVLMLLKMLVEYCHCVDDIPTITPDILTRLVELLKMFNSRTCQLILGAGALQLVGLKTITTKNLALASRCLQVVVYFLPRVRVHFTERLQAKQANMVKHLDSVQKDYNDHIAELSNKLVSIVENMLEGNLNKWEVKAPMPSTSFRNICKSMSKLHEAICDLLPANQILDIFRRMHSTLKVFLRSQLIRLGVTNDGGPQHALVMTDVKLYISSLRSLPGLERMDVTMVEIWDKR